MGAAASIEGQKPMDASDILASKSLEVARGEVVRLRTSLGHLAKKHPGFDVIVIDASDLCNGVDEEEDFKRCVAEVVHIRAALRLSTQGARRQTRAVASSNVFGFGSDMGAAAALAAQSYQGRPNLEMDYATDSGSSSDDDADDNADNADCGSGCESDRVASAGRGLVGGGGSLGRSDVEEEKKEEAVSEVAAAANFVSTTLAAAVADM